MQDVFVTIQLDNSLSRNCFIRVKLKLCLGITEIRDLAQFCLTEEDDEKDMTLTTGSKGNLDMIFIEEFEGVMQKLLPCYLRFKRVEDCFLIF